MVECSVVWLVSGRCRHLISLVLSLSCDALVQLALVGIPPPPIDGDKSFIPIILSRVDPCKVFITETL